MFTRRCQKGGGRIRAEIDMTETMDLIHESVWESCCVSYPLTVPKWDGRGKLAVLRHSPTNGSWRFSEIGNCRRHVIASVHRDCRRESPQWRMLIAERNGCPADVTSPCRWIFRQFGKWNLHNDRISLFSLWHLPFKCLGTFQCHSQIDPLVNPFNWFAVQNNFVCCTHSLSEIQDLCFFGVETDVPF